MYESSSQKHVATTELEVLRLRDGVRAEVRDSVVVEEPMEIRVDGRSLAVLMRTPGRDEELAAGFLRSEGFIEGGEDIAAIRPCEGGENILRVSLVAGAGAAVRRRLDGEQRYVVAGSSCGVCGKASIEMVRSWSETIVEPFSPSDEVLEALPALMRPGQELFDLTGGIHAAALFDANGRLLCLREDIGRHNATDKLIGSWILAKSEVPSPSVLLVSGRVSFEIVQKSWAAGIPSVAAVGAASSLAVALAADAGISLACFVAQGRWNRMSAP